MERRTIEAQVDRHTIRFHQPALFHVIGRGDLTAAHLGGMLQFVLEHSKGLPHVLVLNDMKHVGSISPEARKFVAQAGPKVPFRVMAYYGMNFAVRAAVTLALGAMRLLSSKDCRFRFFKSEPEARAWIEEEQRALYPPA